MTRDQPCDDPITSDDEFEAILAETVEKAIEAGVNVRGAWEFQTNESTHAWDVVIDEVVKDRDENE